MVAAAAAVAAAGVAVGTADMEEGAVVITITMTTRTILILTVEPMPMAAAAAMSTKQPRVGGQQSPIRLCLPRALAWQARSLKHRQVLVVTVVVKMDLALDKIVLSILVPPPLM